MSRNGIVTSRKKVAVVLPKFRRKCCAVSGGSERYSKQGKTEEAEKLNEDIRKARAVRQLTSDTFYDHRLHGKVIF